ncbi:Golgi transport complex subunit 5-domain-containing protein [Blakeslea trispora]|nr:Golgi transport complex subunit 5-domain-containing protein [Blakeslea trispora]
MPPTTKLATQDADKYIDYDTFLAPDFDANTLAQSIITDANASAETTDIGTELSKLAFSIEAVNKQIREQVVSNYDRLLGQVAGIKELDTTLTAIEVDINGLHTVLQALAHKIRDPYQHLSTFTTELENIQTACDYLRKIQRFMLLKRRLASQLSDNDRDMSTAALTVYELDTILKENDLDGIDIVHHEIPFVTRSSLHIQEEASSLLKEGIDTQNQTKMAMGLQVFFNMKQMSDQVQQLTQRMLHDLKEEMKQVINIQSLQKGLTESSNRRMQPEQVPQNPKQLATVLWERMEKLMKSMSDQCIKICSLEKVLEIKKDALTHVSFLDEVAKVLDANSLGDDFERELKNASKASSFLQNTFVSDYPKLLKLLHEFFARVAMQNGTSLTDYSQTPEYVIMLRSFSTFQTSFLAKSLQRMNDAVNSTFPTYGGLARTPPGRNNVINITRIIGHELETVSFEPQLSQLLAKNAVKSINTFCKKCEQLLPVSEQPVYATKATSANINYLNMNIEIANILYFMHQSVWKILEEYPEKTVDIVKKGADDCHALMMKIGNRLVNAIKKDVSTVLFKIHQEDFSGQIRKNFDPEDDKSSYMKELAKHVRYYHTTILQNLSCGAEPKSWVKQISKHTLHVFIFQASLVRPLSEAGKLKLAGDMAELEFTVSQFLSEYGAKMEEIGDEYRALRAFRPLLFLDSAQLTAAHHTSGLSKLILIHHLIVRSQQQQRSLPLPHTVYDLSREDYMKWMSNQTTEKEAIQLVMDAISNNSKLTKRELEEMPEYKYIQQIASEDNLE